MSNPELVELLAVSDPTDVDQAWESFLGRYSRLIMHAVRSPRMPYDRIMDRYTYVLGKLREDECRRLREYRPQPGTRFSTWLVVVVQRLAIDHQRSVYGRVREASEDGGEARRRLVDLVGARVDLEALPGPRPDPDREIYVRDRRAALAGLLQDLDARDRMMLALRFEDDASAREIAEAMGFPSPFHVYRRLKKVLAYLRSALRQMGIRDARD